MNSREIFVKTIMEASKKGVLSLETTDKRYLPDAGQTRLVIIEDCKYGGARWDRIRERNRITKSFGFPVPKKDFLSVDELGGTGGTFLADVLCSYGDDYWFVIDGARLSLENDLEVFGGDYIALHPFDANAQEKHKCP